MTCLPRPMTCLPMSRPVHGLFRRRIRQDDGPALRVRSYPGLAARVRPRSVAVPIEDRPPWDSSPAKAPPRNRSRSTSDLVPPVAARAGVPIAIARAWFVSRSRRIQSPARARTSVSASEGDEPLQASAKQRPAGRRRCRRCRRCRRFGVAETSPGPGSERVRRRVVPRGRVRRRATRVARRAAPGVSERRQRVSSEQRRRRSGAT